MSASDEEEISFTINKAFASQYDEKKRGHELSQARDKYGDVGAQRLNTIVDRQHRFGYTKNNDLDYDSYDSEDDEEEDEDGELITPALDGQIMKTIGMIRSQNPKIYEATSHFFIPEEMEEARKKWKEKQIEDKKNKPMNLQEYHRKVLLEDGGLVNEEAEANKQFSDMTHVEQQEHLKKEMKSAFMEGNNEDDGEDGDSFFTQKAKTKADEDAEEEDYKRFLIECMGSKKSSATDFENWREYKSNPEAKGDEAFLMNYILNRGWIDKSQKKTPSYKQIVREDELDELEKSEDELDAAEEFESKYNFRYEEAEGDKLVSYSRTIDESVRNKDDKRKERRRVAKERKKEEKLRQMEELKRAKNLKKEEIFKKLKQIQEITGNDTVGFDEVDLDTDFNPEEYDRKMENVFSDKYYDENDANVKPVFDDDVDTADYEKDEDDNDGNGSADSGDDNEENRQGEGEEEEYAEGEDYGYDESGGYYDENGNYITGDGEYYEGEDPEDVMMDADFLPDGTKFGASGKKETKKERLEREKAEKLAAKKAKKKGIRTAVEAIEEAKSMLDSDKKKKDFESYLDEYYQLDYEDMVGDQPTRFKYHKVGSSSYGLSPVEILLADDADLNEFVSLKKFAPYRRSDMQESDIKKYSKKNRVQLFRSKLKQKLKKDGAELEKSWDPAERRKKEKEKKAREEGKEKSEEKSKEKSEEKSKEKSEEKSKDKKRKASSSDESGEKKKKSKAK
ncbi:hypothetical protein BGW38_001782 [Lunasporangiospora selenospora]|uniref:Kri1-like C-terminal domain-containing protein n=1 Tax=Lunasporangiospora selenospora TaxID=979761 RepID=A0A9P6KE02_9FUNG|nr:hypothetical protein BGW38_001782 [Lunasporangiospora selenospora]